MKRYIAFLTLLSSTNVFAILPSQCITIEQGGGYSWLVNSCNEKLEVRWIDQGTCNTGCSSAVRAGGKEMISRTKGRVEWAACVSPGFPRNWHGNGAQYSCE